MDNLQKRETMTSREIAALIGKPHSDLMKAIRKMEKAWVEIGQGKFSSIFYKDKYNRDQPGYELTKAECLYIATKFNDEARAKLIIRWQELENKQMSPAEQLLQNAQLLVEQERKISEHDSRIRELESKTITKPDYYTIAGYGNLNGININIKIASRLGRAATKLCQEKGLDTDECPDPRFGRVKMYPKKVLDEVFETVSI